MVTVREAYKAAAESLKNHGTEFYNADARILLECVLGIDSGKLALYYDSALSEENAQKYREYIKFRIKNVPVSYITNKKEFYSLDFYVDNRVLIPRFDTEILADEAIKHAQNVKTAADLCCGSGCIGLTLAKFCPHLSADLFDISDGAVEVSRINTQKLDIKNADVIKLDILKNPLPKKYDMILSNPPYIPICDIDGLSDDVKKYEPVNALTDGLDGLTFYKRLKILAQEHLNDGGIMLLEIGINQLDDMKKIFGEIEFLKDINGIPRVIIYKKR